MMTKLTGFILLTVLSSQSLAYSGAVSSATAETGRASIEPTEAPFLNPASLAQIKGYIVSAGYSTMNDKNRERGQDFALAVTDNLTETIVPTSLGYTQSKVDFASEEQVSRDFRLSVGNYIRPKFSMGLALRYKDDQLLTQRYSQGNMNIGALYNINSDVGLAAVVENIMGARSNIPEDLRLRPTLGLGFSSIYRKYIRTQIDVVTASNQSFDRPTLGLGLETYFNRWVIFRLGTQKRNEQGAQIYSVGLGFAGPRFGLHYAYLHSAELESFNRHSIDLAFPIW